MPSSESKLARWQKKHTAWNSWTDLSYREHQRLRTWFALGEVQVLQGGAAASEVRDLALLSHITHPSHLQAVRRLLLAQPHATWVCAVPMKSEDPHDPLLRESPQYNEKMRHDVEMVRAELAQRGVQCYVQHTRTPETAEILFQEVVKSKIWKSANVRAVCPVTEVLHAAHRNALDARLAFHAFAAYGITKWPTPHQLRSEKRHVPQLSAGGSLYLHPPDRGLNKARLMAELKVPESTSLWLYYMRCDAPPSETQVRSKEHQGAYPTPFSQDLRKGVDEGDTLAFFLAKFVIPRGKPAVVVVPTLTRKMRARPHPQVTVVGYKPHGVQAFLRHCEDWVACEDVYTLGECVRAGKRVFFSTTPNTQELWEQYHRGLAQHVGVAPRTSYQDVMAKASKTALKKFGAAYENLSIVAQ